MNVIDTLFLSLGVDAKGIDKGLNEAQAKIQAGAQGLANSLMAPFKTALGAVAAGLSLGAVTSQYLQQADAIGKMADSIGVDMEELQAWGEAAARAGGSAQGFQASLQNMNRMLQMTASTGKGPAAIALEQFGIKATDASGKARDSFEILRDLAGAMEGMDKQKAMGFGQRLGLDRGTIMLLQSGKVAVDDLIRRQKDLGVYTKEDAEISAKANDAIADLGQVMKASAAIVMRMIVPAITWVTDKMTIAISFFRRHEPFVKTGIAAIAAIITAKMIPALIKQGIVTAKAFAPFYALAAIIALVAAVVDDLWTYMHGGESALEGFWSKFGTGPELLAKFEAGWKTAKQFASDFFNAILPYAGQLAKALVAIGAAWGFGKMIAGISNVITSIKGIGTAISTVGKLAAANPLGLFLLALSLIILYWDDIVAISKKFFDKLGEWVSAAGKWLSQLWSDFLANTKKIWEDVKETIKQKWEDIKNSASELWESIKTKAGEIWDDIKTKAGEMWDGIKTRAGEIWDNIKNTVTAKMKALWDTLVSIFAWDNIKTAANNAWETIKTTAISKVSALWDSVTTLLNWDNIKASAIASWEAIKTSVTTKMSALWESLKSIFAWETWETAFANIFNISFEEIGQKISKIFSWDEWKKLFAGIFNIDWQGVITAVVETFRGIVDKIKTMFSEWIDGLIQRIKGIIDMIPGVDTVKNAAGAVGDAVSGAWGTVKGWFGGNEETPAKAAVPSPSAAVPSQAAAAANVTETTNNTTNNDSHNTYNITVNNQPNAEQFAADLEGFGRRGPGLGRMAASGQTN